MSIFAAPTKIISVGGRWEPIKNIEDSHVVEIAQFAVTQYNQKFGKELSSVKIIKGETMFVAGWKYLLVLAAMDGSATENYEAVVWEQSWSNSIELISFERTHRLILETVS